MKLIPLNQGSKKNPTKKPIEYYAIVDDEDYEALMKYRWHVTFKKDKRTSYVTRWHVKPDGKPSGIKMHRQVMGVTDPKVQVDHEDHNGLNCQKSNLRIANQSQNGANRRSSRSGSSKYLGVHRHVTKRKIVKEDGTIERVPSSWRWCAKIRKNNYEVVLGRFTDEIEAAKAYDVAAKWIHGEFANLNFKD